MWILKISQIVEIKMSIWIISKAERKLNYFPNTIQVSISTMIILDYTFSVRALFWDFWVTSERKKKMSKEERNSVWQFVSFGAFVAMEKSKFFV